MTESSDDEWWEAFRPFFKNSEDTRPDMKGLVDLLRRSNDPLPEGFRDTLAEILDSRLPDILACNWQLQPVYVGRYADEARSVTKEARIMRAEASASNPTKAMANVDGMSQTSAWRFRRKMKKRRAALEALLANSSLSEEQKTEVRRSWDDGL